MYMVLSQEILNKCQGIRRVVVAVADAFRGRSDVKFVI